jgi:hypothetical protein
MVLFGLATAAATIASDSMNWYGPVESRIVSAKSQTVFTYYPIRRTLRVIVESSVDFRGKLFILDEVRIKKWLDEDVFDPLVTINIFGGVSTFFQPPRRGFYAFIVYNDLNETQEVTFRFTEYGYEYDLLTDSTILTIVGGVLILLCVSIKAFGYKKYAN